MTLKYTPQPAFTFQYPAERRPVAPRFRGVLRLQVEPETGAQTCIVCDQCAKVCPDDLIALGGHREAWSTRSRCWITSISNLSRCSFCGLCAEVCPTKPVKALIMSEDYELGSYSRQTQIPPHRRHVRRACRSSSTPAERTNASASSRQEQEHRIVSLKADRCSRTLPRRPGGHRYRSG